MKRIGVVGVCVAAAVAFGVLSASSAYAGEYGVCLKTKLVNKQYTGEWKDAGCEKDKVTHGEYQWYPGKTGIGQPGVTPADFELTSKDAKMVLSWAAGKEKIECKKSIDAGAVLGAQENVETTLYDDCELIEGKTKIAGCNGWENSKRIANLPKIIVFADTYLIDHGTLGLSERFGYTGEAKGEPKEFEVWNAYFGSKEYPSTYPYGLEELIPYPNVEPYTFPYIAEFDCGGDYFRVSGSAAGVVTPVSKMTDTWKVEFGAGKGEQDLKIEYAYGGVMWTAVGPSVLTDAVTNTTKDKSKIEIRECNETGAKIENPEKPAQPCIVEQPLPWLMEGEH